MDLCVERGAAIVRQCRKRGATSSVLGDGDWQHPSSSIWMHCFTNIPLNKCVGAGAGLNDEGIMHKFKILKIFENYKGNGVPLDIIRYFGGLEMVMAIGAMLQAAELKMIILVDGFIMTNSILAASKLYPAVLIMPYSVIAAMSRDISCCLKQ